MAVGGLDQAQRDDTLGDRALRAVDVGDEGVERAHALGEAGLQRGPLVGAEHARHGVDQELGRAAGAAEVHATVADRVANARGQRREVVAEQGEAGATGLAWPASGVERLVAEVRGRRVGAGRGHAPNPSRPLHESHWPAGQDRWYLAAGWGLRATAATSSRASRAAGIPSGSPAAGRANGSSPAARGWRREQAPPEQQRAGQSGWYQTPDGSWALAGPTASGKATAALILGILGIVFCPIVFSILALVFGHQGRNEIDGSGGRMSGRGLATAGIVLGWIGIVIWGLLIALGVIGAIVGDSSTGGGGAPGGVPA